MTGQRGDVASRLVERLCARATFGAALDELQKANDPALCAELLAGATWSRGVGMDDRIRGGLRPGPRLKARILPRALLDALLLYLVTHSDSLEARAIRDLTTALRVTRKSADGAFDMAPLAALPNLRSLALIGVCVQDPPPRLRLDRLELTDTSGLSREWLEAAAPADFWTNSEDVPRSVVRLCIDGGCPEPWLMCDLLLPDLPLLEELQATDCSTMGLSGFPRLRSVTLKGSYPVEVLGELGDLPALETLSVEHVFNPEEGERFDLGAAPRLRRLSVGGIAMFSALPRTVTHLQAFLSDLAPLAVLDRPVELRLGGIRRESRPTTPFPSPLGAIRDGSALTLLDVSDRDLTEHALFAVRRFPGLRRLHLARTAVTHLDGIANHPRIEVIDVSDCERLADVSALATLPSLRVVVMAGACGVTPAQLPTELQWAATVQRDPDIEALLTVAHRQRPPNDLPLDLPASATRLYHEAFPLMLSRDYDAIDVAIDQFVQADIPEVWDWWLHGVDLDLEGLWPYGMPRGDLDRPFARHAALRLIGAAPETCSNAASQRQCTRLSNSNFDDCSGGRFDLSLLAGLPNLETVRICIFEIKLPDSPRPDWLPRLQTLVVLQSGDNRHRHDNWKLERRLRQVLPHVPTIVVG